MFVIAKLIEAGAGWCEQNDIPWLGNFGRMSNCGFQSFGMVDFRTAVLRRNDLRFDLRRRGPDGVDALYPFLEQLVQHGVVAIFVLAAQYQVDVRGERLD